MQIGMIGLGRMGADMVPRHLQDSMVDPLCRQLGAETG